MRSRTTPVRWYRRDITGLRSIAIIPVVAFHAGASFIPGGFIGVDIFYVISGFLITTLLVTEAETSGRLNLGTFWAKRIRRLVPALVVTLAVTLPIAALLGSVLSWDTLATEAVASALFLANVLFWRQATNYFDTGSGQSPFLHMWSLGVEEQFYIMWPLVIIAVIWLVRRRLTLRATLGVVFGGVFVVSFVLSLWLTPTSPDAAFYMLPTRAWEFAGAGILALLPLDRMVTSRVAASVLGSLGLIVLVYGFVTLSEADRYPGYLAMIPFIGTILLIVSGSGARSVLASAFESRPAVWIGNVSYSWYLWHWPLIVFAAQILPANPAAMAVAGLLSLGFGTASYYFVEQPMRLNPFLAKSLRRTYLVGGAATATVVAIAVGVYASGSVLLRSEPLATYAAAADTSPRDDCHGGIEQQFGGVEACILGDPQGERTVVLIGDSHAGHWGAAMDAAATEAGFRLVFRWKSACPSINVVIGTIQGVQNPDCAPFREGTMDILDAIRPDAVIISNAYGYDNRVFDTAGNKISLTEQRQRWRDAWIEQIEHIENMGSHVAVVRDNPRMPFNPTLCLSRLGSTPGDCVSTWQESHSIIAEFADATDEVITATGISSVWSVDDDICDEQICHAVDSDGVPVYQDQDHLSQMWTLRQKTQLEALLRDLVR